MRRRPRRHPAADGAAGSSADVALATFAVEVALARLLVAYGVVPDAVVAEGPGDLAAAHVAGVLSLADAAALAAARAVQLRAPIDQTSGNGAAAAVPRRPVTPPAVPPAVSPGGVSLEPPRLPLLTYTGEPLAWERLAEPPVGAEVAAAAALPGAALRAAGTTTLVLVGRGDPVGGAAEPVVPLLLPGRSAGDGVVTALARLHVRGLPVDWEAALAGRGGRVVTLPTYAFQRRRYWPEAAPAVFTGATASGVPHARAGDDEEKGHMRSEVERKEVVREYFRRLSAGDVDGAVALYAEDGRIEDPVGSRPHVGREAVRAHIASAVDAKLEVTVGEPCAAQDGVRVAVPLVGSIVQPADPSGPRVRINCVDVVSVGDDGLISEVLVFWGLSDVAM